MGLNPFITGFIESVTGTSLLSGAHKDQSGGILPSVLRATAEGLPQWRMAEALLSPDTTTTSKGNDTLFARDDRGPLTSLFGIPLRNMSQETAEKMAGLEAGRESSTGRRRRRRRRR
jgi:hypothetical protein